MESSEHLSEEDRLKAENDFLKMKLMLERGASFGGNENNELPPEIENQFLNNVMAFEDHFQDYKMIKVFDKIGRPHHFKPASEIPDDEIKKAWSELQAHLNEHSIDLDVCSPNIPVRELYRFAVEELFEQEMDDMDMPGWTTHFIYDEFHPDPVYDNTRIATYDCINYILQKEPVEQTHNFKRDNLRLNKHYPLSRDSLKNIINRFKSAYDNLEIDDITADNCTVEDKLSTVTGTYAVTGMTDTDKHTLSGSWKVILTFDEESEYWYVTEVEIAGIDF